MNSQHEASCKKSQNPFVISIDNQISDAKIKRNHDGVVTYDSTIEKNAQYLWNYFLTYLKEKPNLKLIIHGYHSESYIAYKQKEDANGQWVAYPEQRSREVDDFYFSIDLISYIANQWSRIHVSHENKSNEYSLETLLEDYIASKRFYKEIRCDKQILGWNWEQLNEKIKTIILSTGYKNTIDIKYSIKCYRITARSSSKLNRLAASFFMRFLCIISCLCLIFAPIYYYFRSKSSLSHQILADYQIIYTMEDFLRFNHQIILDGIKTKAHQMYSANLM